MSTHVEHLLDVELVVDAVSEDVLVLPYEGDVGVGQIHPRFLRGETTQSGPEDDSDTGGTCRQTPHIHSSGVEDVNMAGVHVSLHKQQRESFVITVRWNRPPENNVKRKTTKPSFQFLSEVRRIQNPAVRTLDRCPHHNLPINETIHTDFHRYK